MHPLHKRIAAGMRAAAAPASNILLSASFTAADGTLIEDYTPEIGSSFSAPIPDGIVKIANNRPYVFATGANPNVNCVANVGSTDYKINCVLGHDGSGGGRRILIRDDGAGINNYMFYKFGTLNRLYKVTNLNALLLLTGTASSTDDANWEFVVSGTSLTVTREGVPILDYTMDSYLTNTYVGISADSAEGTSVLLADNFVVTAL